MANGEATQQWQRAATIPAQARIHVASSDAVRPHERFDYWRETIANAVFGISIESAPAQFSARLMARSAGPLRFAVSESTAYEITRKRREIDNGPSDHYSIYLQLSGRTSSEFDEQTFSFTANDMGVYDGRLPFRALHAGRRAIAVVPRDMLELRAPWLRARLPYKFGRSPYLKLARRHLLQLSTAKAPLGEVEASLLTENLCNLIVLASSSEIEPGYLPADLQTEAILAFCRQNLHDPELSPQRVAGRFRMSVRTLHARFSRIGQTFGRWVLENRLEACRAALRDENQRTLNISDIAYRWGFNDLSHFNKSFRARFGTTPREWRNEAAAA